MFFLFIIIYVDNSSGILSGWITISLAVSVDSVIGMPIRYSHPCCRPKAMIFTQSNVYCTVISHAVLWYAMLVWLGVAPRLKYIGFKRGISQLILSTSSFSLLVIIQMLDQSISRGGVRANHQNSKYRDGPVSSSANHYGSYSFLIRGDQCNNILRGHIYIYNLSYFTRCLFYETYKKYFLWYLLMGFKHV